MLAELYVDETNTHEGPEFICVAGYLFLRNKAKTFSRKFRKKLDKHALPYFHMKECAHNTGVFGYISKDQCGEVETKLISLTKEYSEIGFIVSLHKETYRAVMPESLVPELGSEYSFCLREIIYTVRRWIERTGFTGDITYFFESGAEHQSEANRILTNMFITEKLRSRYNYAAHSFVDKSKFMPLGSADLLAWLYQNHLKRDKRLPSRGDFRELLRMQDLKKDLDKEALIVIFNQIRAQWPHLFDQQSSSELS